MKTVRNGTGETQGNRNVKMEPETGVSDASTSQGMPRVAGNNQKLSG